MAEGPTAFQPTAFQTQPLAFQIGNVIPPATIAQNSFFWPDKIRSRTSNGLVSLMEALSKKLR